MTTSQTREDWRQREHLLRCPWMKPNDCTCRVDGSRLYYTCKRVACCGKSKACGGYCRPCFDRIITNRPAPPEVVVLCGSTRWFSDAWIRARDELTLAGKIVLTKSDEGLGITEAQREVLDELHKRKIDMADRVLVLNVGGYIGTSTRSEIEYAEWFEKPIDYLDGSHLGHSEPGVRAELIEIRDLISSLGSGGQS